MHRSPALSLCAARLSRHRRGQAAFRVFAQFRRFRRSGGRLPPSDRNGRHVAEPTLPSYFVIRGTEGWGAHRRLPDTVQFHGQGLIDRSAPEDVVAVGWPVGVGELRGPGRGAAVCGPLYQTRLLLVRADLLLRGIAPGGQRVQSG